LLLDNEINGDVFLNHAGDFNFFDRAGFPYGVSDQLARLAKEIMGGKSKCCRSTSYTLRRQPANNVTGDSGQAGLAESSDTAPKRPRLDLEFRDVLREILASSITSQPASAPLPESLPDLTERARK
jgi:hypothetical protein